MDYITTEIYVRSVKFASFCILAAISCPKYISTAPIPMQTTYQNACRGNVGKFLFFSIILDVCNFLSLYGGYRNFPKFSPTKLKSRIKTDFLWLKISKEYFPWYAPYPDAPTPPNGRVSTESWTQTSFTQILPDDVLESIFSRVCLFSEKIYKL